MKLHLLAVTLFALPIAASAADLPLKAPPFVPVPVSDWSGVYVGGEAGYGWGKQTTDYVDPGGCFEYRRGECRTFGGEDPVYFPDASIGSIKQKGWLAGAFFGAQKQWGSWVLGIEANVDAADIKGSAYTSVTSTYDTYDSTTFITNHTLAGTSTVDMLGSVRGKVGFVPAPAWMLYGTGGLAFAHVKDSATNSFSYSPSWSDLFFPAGGHSVSGATSLFGWVAGAGVDYKIMQDAGSSWVFGVEYLHYQFNSNTFTLNDGFGDTVSFNGKQSVDTVVGRISYLFAIH